MPQKCALKKDDPIVITGAAGLVGVNLVTLLLEQGHTRITALDKNKANIAILQKLHPGVAVREVDLAEPGDWQAQVAAASVVFLLHAQIAAKTEATFTRNNVDATRLVLDAVAFEAFVVHVSSSVVHSAADDAYVRTKRAQEELVAASGKRHCIVRPTLMFGWFDGKHLGWLGRFMDRVPVFPIPGHGRYLRQPLYSRDLCRVLLALMELQPNGPAYDLTGPEEITYIDIIKTIRDVKRSRTLVLRIPYVAFDGLLRTFAMFSSRPPFTSEQLAALVVGDMFEGVDIEATFGFAPTPFRVAIEQTLCDPVYSSIVLESPH